MSGLFALLKLVTLSIGLVLLNAFILVSEGNGSLKYEGYVLLVSLFIIKYNYLPITKAVVFPH